MSCGNFGDRGPLLQGDGAMGAGAVRGVLGLLHSCVFVAAMTLMQENKKRLGMYVAI